MTSLFMIYENKYEYKNICGNDMGIKYGNQMNIKMIMEINIEIKMEMKWE